MTNTTKESSKTLLERLSKIGFQITANEIHSSLKACHNYVKENNLNPFYLLTDDAIQEFPEKSIDNSFDCVVVGLAPEKFYYDNINSAFK